MKKTYLITIFYIIAISKIWCQGVIQHSVLSGFQIETNIGAQAYQSDVLSENIQILPTFSFGLKYGFNEKIGVYGDWQYAVSNSVSSNELFFQYISDAVTQKLISGGIYFAFGNNLKKWRFITAAGVSVLNHEEKLHGLLDSYHYRILCNGIGGKFQSQIYFFPKPFLSFNANLSPSYHQIWSSEYLGQTFKENFYIASVQLELGLAYHFNGR